ncbi:MAG TPA: adenylate/guanylate cyclase domain-containing protein [Gammaproteobacteria bacterium]|nr:adenylate/guanylate cyclase domain-containing protein [Gammaproteobacteria bacterium]
MSPPNPGQDSIRYPIWAKITGIVSILLVLMAVVTYSTGVQLGHLKSELAILSQYDIPLDEKVNDLRYYNLAQVLTFERIIHIKFSKQRDPAEQAGDAAGKTLGACKRDDLLAAMQKLHEQFPDRDVWESAAFYLQGHCADGVIDAAHSLVGTALASPDVAGDPDLVGLFTSLQAQLEALPGLRANLVQLMQTSVDASEQGKLDNNSVLREQVDQNLRLVGKQVSDISLKVRQYTEAAAARADALEQRAILINWGLTLIAAILGFLLAAFLARNLVKPVRELLSGATAVKNGDLSAHVQVHTADEIALLAQSFNYMVSGLKEKESIKATFGQYVDPRIVNALLAGKPLTEAGEKRVMTVFFSDIAGFTSLGEQLTPDAIVRLLNHYLSAMSKPIGEHKGIIDKYIGDAIMAFWGPPFTGEKEHALLACQAALQQLENLKDVRRAIPDVTGLRRGLPKFDVRMGICTGPVTAGTIGSENAKNYTVIGDTVNLASRLESANKYYGTRIMMAGATYETAKDGIEARELDSIRVLGKSEPVEIYELLGLKGQAPAESLKLRDHYAAGLGDYRQGRWASAREAFQQCLLMEPEDGPAKALLKRIQGLEARPPAAGWDGVWNLDEK